MDVGVDRNAKFAITCRKTILIPENDEESAHSGIWQHFQLQFGTSTSTMMHRPFSICNHSSHFNFCFAIFANCLHSWTIM